MGDPQMTMVDDSATKLRLKCKPWDSLTLLSGCACAFDSGQLPDQLVRQTWGWSSLRELLWHEVCSEYDARHFLAHSLRRGGSMSADFSRFKDLWLAEENNHYLGFRRLYQRLTLMSETRLTANSWIGQSRFTRWTSSSTSSAPASCSRTTRW